MKESTAYVKRKIASVKEKTEMNSTELIYAVITHIVTFFAAYFCTKASVLGKYLPFGISAAAGCPFSLLPTAAVSAILGYFFPLTGQGGFRYMAATVSVLAIRLLTSKIKFTKENPLFLGFMGLLCTFFTGVATLRGLPGGVTFSAIEALLAGCGAYFIFKGSFALENCEAGLSNEQAAGVIITISIVLLGFSSYSFDGIVLGRIAFIILLLLSARQSGAGAGAILGIAAALCSALLGASAPIIISLCFGGLISGVFADVGKFAESLSFAGAAMLGAVIGGFNEETVNLLIEAFIACGIYIMIPKTVIRKLSKFFAGRVTVIRPDGLKKALTMRLKFAGDALNDVSATVENVSAELSKINSPDFKKVLSRIEGDACKGCSMQIFCWETKYDQTLAAIIDMTKAVRNGESNLERFCDEEFRCRCIRSNRVGSAVYKHYTEYASKMAAEKRIEEVRSVVTDQFSGMAKMLSSLANEFDTDERFDTASATRVAAALKNIDIVAAQCGVKIDKNERITVDICVKGGKDIVLNRADIMRVLCVACDRDFDPPCITVSGDDAYITASEHAYYSADIGVNQIGSNGQAIIGDSYDYFFDGKGQLVLILSDGMGTGGRAAVDGAMASGLMSRLIKSGFDFDAALKILNSSMLFKSTDESLATLDITVIDLFSGKTQLLKAGAAPTLVRRNGKAGKAQSTSLPAGILRGVSFDKAVITLKKGDIILMMSDGAVSEGTDWISAEIESWGDGSAQALAERISKCARRRRTDKKEDDITVIAAILKTA